jgi:hypothetical protein
MHPRMRRSPAPILTLALAATARAHVGSEQVERGVAAELAKHPDDPARHQMRFGTGLAPSIDVKAKGANVGSPTLPATPPLVAQLVNTDTGACWQSTFTTTRQNRHDHVVAAIP